MESSPSFSDALSQAELNSPRTPTPQPPSELGTEPEPLYKQLKLPREILFVGTVCFAQLFTQAALAQALVPLYYIGDTFNTSNIGQLSWFIASYSLTVGTFILIAGRLGDMYGHKRMFIIGFIWFGIWSLITGFSAFAKSDIFFDICRALQGVGPAFMLPNALAILGRVYPNGKRKGMVFSFFGAAAPNGFLVGAVFSAIFAQFVWWPWTFWVLGIFCFVLAIVAQFAIPDVDAEIKDNKHNRVEFDVYGALTGVAGLVLVNFAWNQGPVVGWDTAYVYVLLIIGVLILLAFVFAEHKAKQPLIPPGCFNMEVAFTLGCVALGWASFGIWIFFFWQFLEVLRGFSPLHCVALFTPVGISGATAAVTTGILLQKLPTSVIMTISMCAFLTGSILVATMPVDQTYWAQTFVAIIVTPWGMDMSFPSATIILSNNMPREHQGIAASLVNTVVNYSISIGLGVAGTVQRYAVPEGDVLKGFRSAWYTGIGFAGMGVVLGLISIFKIRQKATGGGH